MNEPYRKLNREEEQYFARRLRDESDQEARAILVQSIMPWAKNRATKFVKRHKWKNIDEAISAAYAGALRAVDTFDPEMGFRLTTYSARVIWNMLSRAYDTSTVISVSARMSQAKVGDTYDHLRDLKSINQMDPDTLHECAIEDVVGDREYVQLRSALCASALAGLGERHREVIRRRFWNGETLDEIGKSLRLSKERVRQIESDALRELRKCDLSRLAT